jgi:hypothetical protein
VWKGNIGGMWWLKDIHPFWSKLVEQVSKWDPVKASHPIRACIEDHPRPRRDHSDMLIETAHRVHRNAIVILKSKDAYGMIVRIAGG